MPPAKLARLEKAADVRGIQRAFRPYPLNAEDMEFYSDSLNKCRATQLQRKIKDELIESAETGSNFKGVLYGNRGTGKSTEINRLLEAPEIQKRFKVIRMDALDQLNPQTWSVADVLLLLAGSLIECVDGGADGVLLGDLQKQMSPFFPEFQSKVQTSNTAGASGELSILGSLKLGIRIEGSKREDVAGRRDSLANLSGYLGKLIDDVRQKLGGTELLLVGENFDKEQIPRELLEDAFVKYASLLRDLPLHALFTLPVPFVYYYGDQLPFPRSSRYPMYDIPVFTPEHRKDVAGCEALTELMRKRVDTEAAFEPDALELLVLASGGDLYLLFAMTTKAAREAQYRHEDDESQPLKVLLNDVVTVVREQLGIFRNELGTGPDDSDKTTWPEKLDKLRKLYDGDPGPSVPDAALYQLLRRRAVLFFNGRGRYGVHPLGVEILREQFRKDDSFQYSGGGLELGA